MMPTTQTHKKHMNLCKMIMGHSTGRLKEFYYTIVDDHIACVFVNKFVVFIHKILFMPFIFARTVRNSLELHSLNVKMRRVVINRGRDIKIISTKQIHLGYFGAAKKLYTHRSRSTHTHT